MKKTAAKKVKRKPIKSSWAKHLAAFIVISGILVAAVILVADPKKQPLTLSDCSKPPNSRDFNCWKTRVEYLTEKQSAATAFADLRKAYETNTFVQAECHQLTHIIGRAEANKHDTIGQTYKAGDGFCWSGFYHGVVEQFAKNLGPEKLFTDINELCADVKTEKQYSFYHYNCVHGIGHGLMVVKDNELFDSLKSCDAVIDSWERTSCYGGVFMENIMSDPSTNTGHTTKYLKPSEPMYPCTAVDDRYKEQCYMMQTSYALRQIGYDFAKVFDLCNETSPMFQVPCYLSIGRDASGNSVSDVSKTVASCNQGHTTFQRQQCSVGAVKDFISYYHDDQKALQLCQTFTEDVVKTLCTSEAVQYYKSF